MRCFADNIERIRVIDSDRVASRGPYPECGNAGGVHVWTVLASDDFRLSVYRVSVGFAFTGGYLNDPLEVRMFRSCEVRIDRDREPAGIFWVARSPHPPTARDGLLFPIEGVRRHVSGQSDYCGRGRCFAMKAAASARRDKPSLSRIRLT